MAPTPPNSAQFLQGAAQAFSSLLQNTREQERNKIAQQQADTQAAEAQSMQTAREAQTKAEQAKIDAENQRIQLLYKTAAAMHNLQAHNAGMGLQKQAETTGVAPAGAVQTGTQTLPMIPTMTTGPVQMSTQYSLPNMTLDEKGNLGPLNFSARNPLIAAQQQAKVTGIENEPLVQGKIREQQSQQYAEMQKLLMQEAARGQNEKDVANLKNGNEIEKTKMQNEATLLGHRIAANATIGAAQIGGQSRVTAAGVSSGMLVPTPGGGTAPVDMTNIQKQIAAGNLSQGDLSKLGPVGKFAESTALRNGMIVPDDKQKEFIKGAAIPVNTLGLMEQWNDLWQSTPPSVLLNPGNQLNQRLSVLRSQIDSGIANSIKSLESGGRVNKAQIDDMKKAFSPEVLKKGPIDLMKLENYKSLVTNSIRGNLYNLPSEQQSSIMQNLFNQSQAPKTGIDTRNNRKIVSYDNGQTFIYRDTGDVVK